MRFATRALLVPALILAASAIAGAQPSTVILVRHAERATEPANDPVLTDAGAQRAKDLAAALAGARVTAVVTTQLQRTQLTAKPLMESLGLTAPIVVRAGGGASGHADSVAATVMRRPAGDVVLVVGHSNTIPAIIAALGGPKMADLCDGQYSNLYVLEYAAAGAAPRFIKAKYGTADAADADACQRTMRP
jgi:broad specificity phosphatase PhoE